MRRYFRNLWLALRGAPDYRPALSSKNELAIPIRLEGLKQAKAEFADLVQAIEMSCAILEARFSVLNANVKDLQKITSV